MSLSLDQMKEMTRRFTIQPWSYGNLDALDEVCGPDYSLDGQDLQFLKGAITDFRNALPDLKVELGEMIAEGDKVAYSWTMNGTHQGEYHGIAPTSKPVKFTGITIIRFADGKIVHDQFQSSTPPLEVQVS